MFVPVALDSHVHYELSVNGLRLHNPWLLNLNLSNIIYVASMVGILLLCIGLIAYRVYQILHALNICDHMNILYWLQEIGTAISIIILLVFQSIRFSDRQNSTNTFHIPLTLAFATWGAQCFLIYLAQLLANVLVSFGLLRAIAYVMTLKKIQIEAVDIQAKSIRVILIVCFCILFYCLAFVIFINQALYIPSQMTGLSGQSIRLNLVFSRPETPQRIICDTDDL